ncbi:MAG TPA: transcriptional initiation protein Tat [Chitinophagaceae bacterium]|nr:transcriptional initiation protein Tat [Chitinophagaceae bacterium]HAN37327.1 transcriptional initiation protein Tat [Chitinophagaceae bacterium]
MKRRDTLKAIALGTLSGTALLTASCNTNEPANNSSPAAGSGPDRMKEEAEHEAKLKAMPDFFTPHEMATITVLADIIIPKDDISGSATDAKVPEFISFIVKEMTYYQTPLRGGLKWLDNHALKQYQKAFIALTQQQQITIIDAIAYPEKAASNMQQGVSFFNLIRNLTVTAFYTSEMGVKDLGYVGNQPNEWKGVPADVLAQYQLAYSEQEIKICI